MTTFQQSDWTATIVASSPGHTHLSMLHAERGKCNIERWVWPGDEATTIVAAGTSGTIRKSPDPSSPCEGAGPPDYHVPKLH